VVRIVAALAVIVIACASDGGAEQASLHRDSKGSNMSTAELEIVIDAQHVRGMGYGHVWKATVTRVVAGELVDQEIELRTRMDPGGSFYGGRFKDLDPQKGVTLTLRRIPSRPVALVGFVAKDGTIWEIVSAR
jgi:hypothetical protein